MFSHYLHCSLDQLALLAWSTIACNRNLNSEGFVRSVSDVFFQMFNIVHKHVSVAAIHASHVAQNNRVQTVLEILAGKRGLGPVRIVVFNSRPFLNDASILVIHPKPENTPKIDMKAANSSLAK